MINNKTLLKINNHKQFKSLKLNYNRIQEDNIKASSKIEVLLSMLIQLFLWKNKRSMEEDKVK